MKNIQQGNYLLKIKDLTMAIWKEAKILTQPTLKQTISKTLLIILICVIMMGFLLLVGEFIVILFKLII